MGIKKIAGILCMVLALGGLPGSADRSSGDTLCQPQYRGAGSTRPGD